MELEHSGFAGFHRLGDLATTPCALLAGRPALLLVLAGNDHAASSRRASHPANHAHGIVQLRFLG
ncbi:MAG: hypothetical protein BWY57_01313 [Betaproteobacteria bacterium ADurb.Bin341]|nr:MAG: hypothetical protein BWY57_01313 [Betaproteobacteria bacterium ADurb.Bin341]